MRGQLHAPAALPPRARVPRYSFDRRLGGHKSRSGSCGEQENLSLPEIESGPSRLLYRRKVFKSNNSEICCRGSSLITSSYPIHNVSGSCFLNRLYLKSDKSSNNECCPYCEGTTPVWRVSCTLNYANIVSLNIFLYSQFMTTIPFYSALYNLSNLKSDFKQPSFFRLG
jgi:hypothetical protein